MEALRQAVRFVEAAAGSLEASAERRADPASRTSLDVAAALLALLAACGLVFGSVALGWVVLWHTTLCKIGAFRDMVGLNRAVKADARRRAEEELDSLRRQLSQQHGASAPAPLYAHTDE